MLVAAAVLGMACSSASQTVEPTETAQPSTAAQAISIADASTADASTQVIEVDAGSPETPPWQMGQCAAIQVTVSQRVPTVPKNCEILLNGNFRGGDECQMTVQLNGETLDCKVDDGWRLKDPRTIEVTGEPCERYRADVNAELSVDIPCELIEL